MTSVWIGRKRAQLSGLPDEWPEVFYDVSPLSQEPGEPSVERYEVLYQNAQEVQETQLHVWRRYAAPISGLGEAQLVLFDETGLDLYLHVPQGQIMDAEPGALQAAPGVVVRARGTSPSIARLGRCAPGARSPEGSRAAGLAAHERFHPRLSGSLMGTCDSFLVCDSGSGGCLEAPYVMFLCAPDVFGVLLFRCGYLFFRWAKNAQKKTTLTISFRYPLPFKGGVL